jgi:hypothetical protein
MLAFVNHCGKASYPPAGDELGKLSKAPVVGRFDVVGKAAGRQLFGAKMVLETLAAMTLARTGLIGAIAAVEIDLLV